MSNINLLPWREEAKKRKQREFFVLLAGAGLVMVILVMAVDFGIGQLKKAQDSRNKYLSDEIAILDSQISEIKDIKKRRAQIKERINLIQELQVSRNHITELFNSLPDLTPTGVYISTLGLKGENINIKGQSEDNTRLVSMLRSIRSSELFGGTPKPSITNSKGKLSDFSFSFIIDSNKAKAKKAKAKSEAGGKK